MPILLLSLLVVHVCAGAVVVWLGLRVFPNLAPGVPDSHDTPWPAALIGLFWPVAAGAMLFRLAAGKHKQEMTLARKRVVHPYSC